MVKIISPNLAAQHAYVEQLKERGFKFGLTVADAFVRGIDRDRDAVLAALVEPWSTGPVEGQINRLKTIKRQMYGRAGYDLLRKRVLAA